MDSSIAIANIVKHVKVRYDMNIGDENHKLVIKKAGYLARARRDSKLTEHLNEYRSSVKTTVLPVLKKTVKVSKKTTITF